MPITLSAKHDSTSAEVTSISCPRCLSPSSSAIYNSHQASSTRSSCRGAVTIGTRINPPGQQGEGPSARMPTMLIDPSDLNAPHSGQLRKVTA